MEGPVADKIFASIVQQRVFPVRKILRWTAAAAIVTLLVMVGKRELFISSAGKRTPCTTCTADHQTKDIVPGGNQAILTLADGSQITLDSASKGAPIKQGAAYVLKTGNGQLSYQAAESTPATVVYNKITTPKGGQFQIVLPDGSKVYMNAASSIRFPTAFTGRERRIEMSGEAYFEIAPHADQPFIVAVNKMEVAVLGTSFNIMAYEDEKAIQTTLLEGAVNVLYEGHKKLLQPGQQVSLGADGSLQLVATPDVESAIAWKNGHFQFDKADLQSVMRQLSRWYDVEVVYEGKTPDFSFVGQLDRKADLSHILRILEYSQVHFKVNERTIIVTP
jgi:ferric-dicitrate binding protein FerR (iron transport regulator)